MISCGVPIGWCLPRMELILPHNEISYFVPFSQIHGRINFVQSSEGREPVYSWLLVASITS